MLTVLLYVFVVVLVGAVLFFVAGAVFGRGETLAPLPPGTTATVLPATDITGVDVREVRFQQSLRGYKMSEVDWALDRLGREIDALRARVEAYESVRVAEPADDPGKAPAGDVAADAALPDVGDEVQEVDAVQDVEEPAELERGQS